MGRNKLELESNTTLKDLTKKTKNNHDDVQSNME